MGGQEHRLHGDARGRVLGGTIPGQNLTILRVDGAAAASTALRDNKVAPQALDALADWLLARLTRQ